MPTAPTHLQANLQGPQDLGLETLRPAHPPAQVEAVADLLDLRRNSLKGFTTFLFYAKRKTTCAVQCLDLFD